MYDDKIGSFSSNCFLNCKPINGYNRDTQKEECDLSESFNKQLSLADVDRSRFSSIGDSQRI